MGQWVLQFYHATKLPYLIVLVLSHVLSLSNVLPMVIKTYQEDSGWFDEVYQYHKYQIGSLTDKA